MYSAVCLFFLTTQTVFESECKRDIPLRIEVTEIFDKWGTRRYGLKYAVQKACVSYILQASGEWTCIRTKAAGTMRRISHDKHLYK